MAHAFVHRTHRKSSQTLRLCIGVAYTQYPKRGRSTPKARAVIGPASTRALAIWLARVHSFGGTLGDRLRRVAVELPACVPGPPNVQKCCRTLRSTPAAGATHRCRCELERMRRGDLQATTPAGRPLGRASSGSSRCLRDRRSRRISRASHATLSAISSCRDVAGTVSAVPCPA
jgi:hypothetical protein